MAARRRALVIGGSLSGLFVGTRLLRDGWDVRIFERSSVELSGRGAGIVTQRQVPATLRALGLSVPAELGVDISRRQILSRDGQVTATAEKPLRATSWMLLFAILREAFPPERYELGRDLVRVEQDEHAVHAVFADGSRATGDLLVGADGFRSSVRPHLAPDLEPLYAGYVAWRALVAEEAFPEDLHRQLFGFFTFGLPEHQQMLGYPVAEGASPSDGLSYNIVWYKPTDGASDLPRLLTDRNGRRHDMSIPPPLIADDVVADMRARAKAAFAPQFQQALELAGRPFFQPIYDLETPRMVAGRVALIGDAAFVARPHVGAGTAKAADDAMSLGDALRQDRPVAEALLAFEAERLPIGRRIIERARQLGTYLKRDFASEAERQAAQPFRDPEAVLVQNAVLDFL
ncbi:MAG: 2-polyprenyl-6-methoxyphenol hydroxylase-like oxidoreductase [Enterovirga sp.]|jgi:2-polyprenyl-6-methoxyphenol hydroxylase-like FAD-dependent oxidoreductase|nr:2-polyprenyl-6-methoxyphenol hydroxylase-like oxidoreductase [Enterovirga sp.]